MRLIKGFILAIAGLFIMITLVSLLIPSRVMVTRGVEVNATASKVFAEINNLRNWQHWHPVFKNDSSKVIFSNSSCEWETNGRKNKFLITADSGQQVTINLERVGENAVTNFISVLPLQDSNRVQVEWRAVTKLKWYPWEKFYGIFIERFSGPGYEDALKGLKDYVEGH